MTFDKPICFIDTETTSADVNTARIVEISILKYTPPDIALMFGEVIKTRRINPEVEITSEASEVHGITNEMVAKEPTFKQVAKGILEFIEDCDIAGYSSNTFDIPILYLEFSRAGIDWDYSQIRFIDVANIWKRKEERTLARAYKVFCDKDLEGAHGAEADIKATKEIFLAQLDRYDGQEGFKTTIDELALFGNYDKPFVDITGKFTKNATGELIFAFGKHKGKKANDSKNKEIQDYLSWMVKPANDLPADAKKIAQTLLNGNLSLSDFVPGFKYEAWIGSEWMQVEFPNTGFTKDQLGTCIRNGIVRRISK